MEREAAQEQNVIVPPDSGLGDVMVVGAGISGIQAALDLATAGYKVYLVEKAPTVGGKMAQLDKTFPTNDCSMCIESPKFIECDRHPNICLLYTSDAADDLLCVDLGGRRIIKKKKKKIKKKKKQI